MLFSDIIGIIGVFLCLCAYTLNVLQRIDTDGYAYPALNAISSVMILTSLASNFNLASALMEGSWLCVSLVAVLSAVRRAERRVA
jgi:small-conductance mechanosensitive channel